MTWLDVGQYPDVGMRGCRNGELGDIFFEFLENDPFVRRWHDVEFNMMCTLLKKCDPFLDSFRQWGLHAPEAAAVPCEVFLLVKRLRTDE